MCWNKDVSLNTFAFSSFVLLMILYNNTYTQYKIKEFDSIAVYVFLFSVVSMQLVECFIWKNITNTSITQILSYIGILLVFVQPIAALFILRDLSLRWNLLAIYLMISLPLFVHSLWKYKIGVSVSKVGHLLWENWFNRDINLIILRITYFFMVFFPLFREQKYMILTVGILSLLWAIYNYMEISTMGSMGSMWCWSANSFAIFAAFYILLYLPFQEKMSC